MSTANKNIKDIIKPGAAFKIHNTELWRLIGQKSKVGSEIIKYSSLKDFFISTFGEYYTDIRYSKYDYRCNVSNDKENIYIILDNFANENMLIVKVLLNDKILFLRTKHSSGAPNQINDSIFILD